MSEFWIQTYTGVRFDLLVPTPEMVELDDIAHALSMLCRFTGHTKFFYSVAEHSYQVSVLVENYCRRIGLSAKDGAHAGLEALLHDASEAYVGDVSRPLKKLLRATLREPPHGWELDTSRKQASLYDRIEYGVLRAVMLKFFVEPEFPDSRNEDLIKRADIHMLAVEARQLLDGGPKHTTWASYDPEFAVPHLACMAPETARRMFVMRARELQEVIAGRE